MEDTFDGSVGIRYSRLYLGKVGILAPIPFQVVLPGHINVSASGWFLFDGVMGITINKVRLQTDFDGDIAIGGRGSIEQDGVVGIKKRISNITTRGTVTIA